MVNLATAEIIYILVSIVSAACAVYLFKKYVESRKSLTLLLTAFFSSIAVFVIVISLIYAGALRVNLSLTEISFFVVAFGIVLLIQLVMAEIKELYFLPAFLTAVIIYQDYVLDLNRKYAINFLQYASLSSIGSIIGNPFFILLKNLNPSSVLQILENPAAIDPLFDPLAIIIPDVTLFVATIYLGIVGTIAIIFFYYLAWRNKSGRSLGFALGLTVIILVGMVTTTDITFSLLILIGTIIFALGIFGILDKLIKKEEPQITV